MSETLEIPAGSMDVENENAAACLSRELKEEANLDIRPEDLQPILTYKPNLGFSNAKMHVFMTQVSKNRVTYEKINPDEDVYQIVWMGLNELESHISAGRIQDVKTIMAYWYLKANQIA
jgi:ADP-ribose pyrophosphatase